ncbi:Gfo/Idh/MocA family oxidoreductase [Symmachiella dynata]|uniref:Gfo/Idh/MocA family protein n=1 Tax=Symmachiella dynata TaxID=2527995 RepID=UPI0030EB9D37
MPNKPPYGLLLIAGNLTHQENYARALAADPRCRLIGLTDEADIPPRRAELNRMLAEELGIPLLPDLAAALARDDVQIVSVCAEPERRGRIAAQCARAGKHLYIDKPLGTTVEEARHVVAAVNDAGVTNHLFSLVHTPTAYRAKEIVESGRLGDLSAIHYELMFAKGIAGTADLTRPRQEKAVADRFTFVDSKRELFCVGWYPLIFFPWLTGRRVTSVYATTSNYFFAEHQNNNVEDFSCLLLEMEGGLTATVTCGRTGWSSHPSHGFHKIHLVGEADSVDLDAYEPRLEIHNDTPAWRQPAVGHPEDPMGFWSSTQTAGGVEPKTDWLPIQPAVADDAVSFLDCLQQGRPSDVPVALGAHAVEIILASYQSAAQGQPVTIPLED